jgi:hypothetical protein
MTPKKSVPWASNTSSTNSALRSLSAYCFLWTVVRLYTYWGGLVRLFTSYSSGRVSIKSCNRKWIPRIQTKAHVCLTLFKLCKLNWTKCIPFPQTLQCRIWGNKRFSCRKFTSQIFFDCVGVKGIFRAYWLATRSLTIVHKKKFMTMSYNNSKHAERGL